MFALTHRCVGAYTSRIALPEAALARIPEGRSFQDAAAFPLAALTAWQVDGRRAWEHAGQVVQSAGLRSDYRLLQLLGGLN